MVLSVSFGFEWADAGACVCWVLPGDTARVSEFFFGSNGRRGCRCSRRWSQVRTRQQFLRPLSPSPLGQSLCWLYMCVIHRWYYVMSSLRHNTDLQQLDLSWNKISDDGAIAIGEGLRY